jgi:hypothetical protein
MTPSPDIHVCPDCGWSEFVIPHAWLAAGWLRSQRPQPAITRTETGTGSIIAPQIVPATAM